MDINTLKEIIFYLKILYEHYRYNDKYCYGEYDYKKILKLIYRLQVCIDYYEYYLNLNNRWEQISMEEYDGHEI